RLHHMALFAADRPLYAQRILAPPARGSDGPPLALALRLEPECLERLLTGRPRAPAFSAEFPAQQIVTPYRWDDLVLEGTARAEVDDILAWQQHERDLMQGWGLARRLKPGYRALFYGPPGTG